MMSALEDLGFIREGRHAYHETIDVAVEIPDSYLAGDYKRLRIVRVNGKYDMYMISPEDIIADRMRAVVHWKEGYHTEWMAKILDRHKVDRDYIYSTVETKDEKEFLDAFFKEYDRSRK